MSDCVVLIVDDDDDIRDDLAHLLERRGYRTATAGNGAAALDYLTTGARPCVVLLDLMMPIMAALRAACGRRIGLPATRWMAELGAFVLRTDTELLLKSRRVVPARLLDAGFRFEQPEWPSAVRDLVARWRAA